MAKRTRWERLSWPQVAALAVLVGGVVTILLAVPADKLPPWEVIGGVIAALLGGGASSMLGPLVRRGGDDGEA